MDVSMIHETFNSWAEGLDARFSPGLAEDADQLVDSAVLLSAHTDPQRRAHGPPRRPAATRPLAKLRYLISVGGAAEGVARERALISLFDWAQRTQGLELVSGPLSPSWWLAYGVSPRPAFMLDVLVTERVEHEPGPPVRTHRLDRVGISAVDGRVVAADDTPVSSAEIELLATGETARSDNAGAFRLHVGAGPGAGSPGWVRVEARGVEQRFRIPEPKAQTHPWLIRMDKLGH